MMAYARHEIFAGNKSVPLNSADHSLVLNAEAVIKGAKTDLDELGIAKNARDEKLAQRKKDQDPKHHAEMAKLYAQHVLEEQPTLQIQGLTGGKKKQPVQEVLHKPQV